MWVLEKVRVNLRNFTRQSEQNIVERGVRDTKTVFDG
jgi:hypothetical protein